MAEERGGGGGSAAHDDEAAAAPGIPPPVIDKIRTEVDRGDFGAHAEDARRILGSLVGAWSPFLHAGFLALPGNSVRGQC